MTTISSNIQPPQPVTLCYQRIHKLSHKPASNHTADATLAHSPHASPRASPRHQPPTSPRTASVRLSPASYPCPPQYRNKRRLPLVQQQWYTDTLRSEQRRHCTALPWEQGEVKELRADWSWTLGRLTKRLGKADGVHISKGGRRRSLGGGEQEAEGDEQKQEGARMEEKSGMDMTGMWNTQSLLIRVDTTDADDKQPRETNELSALREQKEQEREQYESDEKQSEVGVDMSQRASSSDSPIRPARAAFLSPTRQRKVSEEEEAKESSSSAQQLQQLTLAASLLPSPSSSASASATSPRHFSFPSGTAGSTNTAHTDLAALDSAALASFNPLPPPFIPSVTVTCDGDTRTRQVKGGESAVLSGLRDEFRFGVSGVGALCRLSVYGYVVWVKEEVEKPQWAQHLRSSTSGGR